MLSDMLEYSFYNPDRLNEALRTKWIRRVSGFYRCNTDDKAYFANLDWDPTNLQYLECACNLYSVLLKDDAGRAFLTSDRRGMLFNEMASEIHYLLVNAASSNYDKNIGGGISNSSSGGANSPGGPPPQKSVFRLFSCNTSMAREFFTLLGRIVKTSGARRLLDGTHIFQNLSRLGSNKSLDYLTRLVFTSLSFTDEGVLSRHLIQLWTAQDSCTPELKVYFHSILRILLQSKRGSSLGPGGSANTVSEYNWVIDVILNQINIGERPTLMICKALEEAVHSKPILRSIIAKKPKILDEPNAQNVLIRFLSVPEGIEYLSESSWLEEALEDWKTKKCKEYAESVEERISLVFTEGNGRQFPRYCRMVEPIPIYTPEFLNTIRLKQSSYVKPSIMSSSATSSSSINRDPNSKLVLDLQGLMRVPWNIELKLTTQPTGSRASYTSTVEYVRMDTYAGKFLHFFNLLQYIFWLVEMEYHYLC